MLAYNPTHRGEWSFNGFHLFVNSMTPAERSNFFNHTLPAIIQLALDLPDLFRNSDRIPFLLAQSNSSSSSSSSTSPSRVSLTQRQIASLLANAFLCTFPRRNKPPKKKHYMSSSSNSNEGGPDNMPTINFNGLFGKNGKVIVNKLRCIVNYFHRVVLALLLSSSH